MKLMIGLPWYQPDGDTFPVNLDMMMYLGGLQERSRHVARDGFSCIDGLPPLELSGTDPLAEPTKEDWDRMGELEIMGSNYSRLSLVGKARELIVEMALEWDADYLFWWDADMRMQHSTFLRLWRHDVPAVGALAFTARDPIHPVIYRVSKRLDPLSGLEMVENSEVVLDYPRDALISSEDFGGDQIAGGGAAVLYNMDIFKEIPQPWFASTGCGEDWFFCNRLAEYNIPYHVDTGVKTQHKKHSPLWADEASYFESRDRIPEQYAALADTSKSGKVLS
tara:strand:- start:2387 stop:3223 length:837 start_codon:yes stop_codon:yes gene_type:complete